MIKYQKDIRELCKKLKPVIGQQADTLWNMYLAEDERGRRDLALEIEIIAEKVLTKRPLENEKILLEPPAEKDCSGSFLLGDVSYNDKNLHPLFLRESDFLKQVGIFAVTGEGKTNLAYLLALQLLKQKTPFMVIDWKRSWRNLLSLKEQHPELKDVRIFTIGRDVLPFLWNPFRSPPGSNKHLWVGTISEALEKSHLSGLGVAYLFNKVFLKLLNQLGDNFYPNFFDGLKAIENRKAYQRELMWQQSALRIFQSFTVGSASKVFNVRNPVKLEDLLDKPVIFELDFEVPKPLRIFFSEIILRWIHLYRLAQGETEKLQHVLFLEEAHNLFSQTGYYKDTNSIENVYREIRSFGQGIVTITQHPSLLPVYLLGNCHTQIYLGLQHEDDIRTARKALFLDYRQEPYLNMLKVGESIIKIKDRIDPCFVKTPLVPVQKGQITDDWLKVNTPGYLPKKPDGNKANSRGSLPLDKDKKGLNGKYRKNSNGHHHKLLVDIFENPFSSITERYKRLALNPKYGNEYKDRLISESFIKPRKIITGKGWILLFDLTAKAHAALRDAGYHPTNIREGIVHKFWKNKIAQFYQAAGFKVLVEEKINGRPDIIVIKHDKKTAVEIETGASDIFGNIERGLKAGFDEVVCVATNRFVEDKIRLELENKKINDARLRLTSVLSFNIL